MLNGAVKAEAIVSAGSRYDAWWASELDAPAEGAGTICVRTVPPPRRYTPASIVLYLCRWLCVL
jgi:hypothetical protein